MDGNTTNERELVAVMRSTGEYHTSTVRKRAVWPAWTFYRKALAAVYRSSVALRKGGGLEPLLNASLDVLVAVESVGGCVEITGLENLQGLSEPVVMVGNHMSSLETFVLPGLTLPFVETTFILKRALLGYPWLGSILGRLDAIAVDRQDPRADLTKVLREGPEHLAAGRSVVVFPQSTRTEFFDPKGFNSLGVKLARRGEVQVLPFAVDTRFWGAGRLLKDVGPIRPEIPVRIAFGAPLPVAGNGKAAQAEVVAFIEEKLRGWQ